MVAGLAVREGLRRLVPLITKQAVSGADDVAAAAANSGRSYRSVFGPEMAARRSQSLQRLDPKAPSLWDRVRTNALPQSIQEGVLEFGLEGLMAGVLAHSLASQELPEGAPAAPALEAGLQAFGLGAGGSVLGRGIGAAAKSMGAKNRIGSRLRDQRDIHGAANIGGMIGGMAGFLPIPALERWDQELAAWQAGPTPQQAAGLPDPLTMNAGDDLRERLLAAGFDPDELMI
jgi:hypothetical protein